MVEGERLTPPASSEWKWAAAFSAAVMLLTLLPYGAGFAASDTQWQFSGFVFGVEDGHSYIAKMQQGAEGAWLYRLAYSAEPQRGALVFAYYLVLGKLASGPEGHLQLVILFHLARLASGFVLLLVSYRFLALFLPEARQRRAGLVLLGLGGGLGWALALVGRDQWLGSLPLDFYSPESFTFLALYGLPHVSAAGACLLGGLILYLTSLSVPPAPHGHPEPAQPGGRRTVLAGVLWLLLGLIQPLYLLVAYTVVGAHVALLALTRRGSAALRALQAGATVVIISLPLALYTAVTFTADPILRQWTAQNLIPSPHPLHYLAAYGLLLAPAALGLRRLYGQEPVKAMFLAGWVLLLPFLVYAPFNLNRRLAEGFYPALAAMAAAGLAGRERTPTREVQPGRPGRWSWAVLVIGLSLPTSFLLIAGGLLEVSQPGEPLFVPQTAVEAYRWLEANAAPGAVVLSAYRTGNEAPAYAPITSYIGHGPETVFLSEKLPQVDWFYQGPAEGERLEFLLAHHVRYVLYGPREAALGELVPEDARYLVRRFTNELYTVYEVLP